MVVTLYDHKDDNDYDDDDDGDAGECGRNCENQVSCQKPSHNDIGLGSISDLCLTSNTLTIRLSLQELNSSLYFVSS